MIEQIYNYFTLEMLYFYVNLGVLPFWLLIILFPHSQLCKFLATSIFPIFLLSLAYGFVLYKSYLNSYDFSDNFNLYLGINYLSELFKEDSFIVLFWIHFVSINLFTGGWILKDSQKFSMNRILISIPLLIIYFIGPLGIFIYWVIRIFYAKTINIYD